MSRDTPPTAAELAVAKRHRTENFQWRAVIREAESLVKDLRNGINEFSAKDYEAIINFMVDDKAARKGFIFRGVFKIGPIEVRRKAAEKK